LIELLIVVAIIGIIAAIAVPNLLHALHIARQKRTMADIRSIGTALEMYQKDIGFYPVLGDSWVKDLRPHLRTYNGSVNALDGWGTDMFYSSQGQRYTLVSYGKNHVEDLPHIEGKTHDLDADIVFSQGTFVQYPEGTQHF